MYEWGGDTDPAYGPIGEWREKTCAPDPLDFDFISKFGEIPGHPVYPIPSFEEWYGLSPYDFRGYTDSMLIDTFHVRVYGHGGSLLVPHSKITIRWDSTLIQNVGGRWQLRKYDLSTDNYESVVPNMCMTASWIDLNIYRLYDLSYLIIRDPDTIPDVYVTVTSGWNLVSVPCIPSDNNAAVVFPDKFGSMFEYSCVEGAYNEASTLAIGIGYWVYHTAATTVGIYGSIPVGPITMVAYQGWNLIGSRNTPVNVSALTVDSGAAIFGSVFRYNPSSSNYEKTLIINPGEAVWVYVTSACTLTIL